MIRSAVTISLVPEARGGPFVFWDGLEAGCRAASELGFDAVEIFAPSADAVMPEELQGLLDTYGLSLAAVGTGAGWVLHALSLSAEDAEVRGQATSFVRALIDFAAGFGAPCIVGSMQGRSETAEGRVAALSRLGAALDALGDHAGAQGVPLFFEPLNRYETNLINTLADGVALLEGLSSGNIRLLADLFHMNIEEAHLDEAIRNAGPHVGHVHFADSNRRAAGFGHLEFGPIVQALRDVEYAGYLSAEAFALPDSIEAATQTMRSYRRLILGEGD